MKRSVICCKCGRNFQTNAKNPPLYCSSCLAGMHGKQRRAKRGVCGKEGMDAYTAYCKSLNKELKKQTKLQKYDPIRETD